MEEIILPDTRLGGNASWSGSNVTSGTTVVYSPRAGVPRPVVAPYSFQGQLLGTAAGDQGNEAVGTWSLGSSGGGKNYLAPVPKRVISKYFNALREISSSEDFPDSGENTRNPQTFGTQLLDEVKNKSKLSRYMSI